MPVDYFMSKLRRNFVTSEVFMENAEPEYDFQYIDLFDRVNAIDAAGLTLLEDEYLYRADVLVHRSWLYQSLFALEHSTERREELFSQGQIPIRSQNKLRQDALELSVYEHSSRSFSPVVALSLGLVLAALSNDAALVTSVVGLWLVSLAVALRSNDAQRVHSERLWTSALRLCWVLWRATVIGSSGAFGVATLAVVGADLASDVARLVRQKLWSTRYEIVKILPGKMYVVIEKRWGNEYRGCDFAEKIVGEDVLELIGREDADQDIKIDVIVDVHGLLCKLTRITKTDLDDIHQAGQTAPPHYFCTQTFNVNRPTANDVTDKHKLIDTFKKHRTSAVMKRGYTTNIKRPSIED